jgi:hypothetical protein
MHEWKQDTLSAFARAAENQWQFLELKIHVTVGPAAVEGQGA